MAERSFLLMLCVLAAACPAAPAVDSPSADSKPRLLVLTDVGGDPDDQQSLVRLLLYANEFEIEGLIASAAGVPGELKTPTTRPELIRQIIDAYGQVYPKLSLHSPDYPPAKVLLGRVRSGNRNRGLTAVGAGQDTEGSRLIIERMDEPDPRPLNITIWGGQTDFAQALWRLRRDRPAADLERLLSRIRVYDIDDQDQLQPWIFENFPALFYILAKSAPGADKRTGAYRGMYLGGDESLTSREWVDANVRLGHGPLGALYPTRTWTAPNPHSTLKEGDTPSWFYFLPTGLGDPERPGQGCWGGRFQKARAGLWRDASDRVDETSDARASVWRWRKAFQDDFQARMDWCVEPLDRANHPPVPVLNGDRTRKVLSTAAKPGETMEFSAAGSMDPDGQAFSYQWFVYPEPSTARPLPVIERPNGHAIRLTIPPAAGSGAVHLVLALTDQGSPPLTRYRRAVIEVTEKQR